MSIRSLSARAFVPVAYFLSAATLIVTPSIAQQAPPAAPGATPPAIQTAPSTPAQVAAATAPASKEPDYPDPRTFVIGVYGLSSLTSSGPDIRGGVLAAARGTYETLNGIGQPYRIAPQIEIGIPVTRTGMLYLDVERLRGDGSQTLTQDSFIDSFNFNKGDVVASAYHIKTGRLYLDDLLFPHKFPVARLRFKSIWGVRYLGITQTVLSPTEDAITGVPGTSFQLSSSYILYPEFGAAMEYAIAPHVLFRVDGAGFAFPHRAALNETSGTLSFRQKNLEVLLGVKTLHFKTSPKKDEYEIGTFITPFLGLRWHW